MIQRLTGILAAVILSACTPSTPVDPGPEPIEPGRDFAEGTPQMQERIRETLAAVPQTTGKQRLALAQRLMGYGEPAIPELVRALEHHDAGVRTLAAYLLGLHKDPRTFDALARVQGDMDLGVRYEAATALARAGDRRGMPVLIDGLDSRDPRVRSRSIKVLQQTTGETFGYRHDDHPSDRSAAVARWRHWLTAWDGVLGG